MTKVTHTHHVHLYMTADWRHDLLHEWWGSKRIIRLAHKYGLYAKAAKARARMREIEALFRTRRNQE